MALILPVHGITPQIGEESWIAPNSTLVGDLVMGKKCSVWFQAIIRADVCSIRIGDECNIQDNAILHGTYKRCGITMGNRVSVGHAAILHGCEIGDGTLIGMGSIIMDLAKIGRHCLVGAGSLVTENSEFPEGSLIIGRPAKVVRALTPEEIQRLEQSADNYLMYQNWFKT